MIYLASQSPQRAMLLQRANLPFTVVTSAADEEQITHPAPQVLAIERARVKARGALIPAGAPDGMALGADTVVALGSTVFGKPTDRADAVRILSQLSGTTHSVCTGHCCVRIDAAGRPAGEAVALTVAKVTMRLLSAAEIQTYVDSGESDGRAGAYAIQEHGDRFVVDVQGAWDTVVGLSVATVMKLYRELTDRSLAVRTLP